MQFPRIATVLLIVVAVTGCRIRIDNPSTGSVITNSGAHRCAAGQTCDIHVVDIFFDETFMAVPQRGYYFVGWKKRDKGLCGGQFKPCHIFTSAFEGNDVLMSFLESDDVFYLQPVFSSAPPVTDVVKIGKHAWAQADFFLNLSWAEISEICSTPKRLCDGQLNGFDVTGWTWASIDNVFSLLVSFGHPPPTYPPTWQYGESDSQWAPAFYDAGFRHTFDSAGRAFVAWTSSIDRECATSQTACGVTASVVDRTEPDSSDFVELLPIPTGALSPGRGAWFYRKASDIMPDD